MLEGTTGYEVPCSRGGRVAGRLTHTPGRAVRAPDPAMSPAWSPWKLRRTAHEWPGFTDCPGMNLPSVPANHVPPKTGTGLAASRVDSRAPVE